jgi:putative endonuclease
LAGEDLAAAWYGTHGYDVVARNWRCREGEIDLVARRGRLHVFCEVKTRSTSDFGSPAEAVTAMKAARVRRLAARWLAQPHVRPGPVRFDVAAVMDGEVDMIEGAF